MTDYAKFQQQVFDELRDLEEKDRDRIVDNFIEIGRKAGIDVIDEILDKGKSASELFDLITKRLPC